MYPVFQMAYQSIEGKTTLITGGSQGIGLGIAETFAGAGARVIITGRNRDKLESAKEKLGDNAFFIEHDVRDTESSSALLEQAVGYYGNLDILINNAGVGLFKPLSDTTVEEFDLMFETNVRGLFALTTQAIPELKKARGNIINICSASALRGLRSWSVYSASKSAVLMLTELWAKELAPMVRVNALSPGGVDTPIFDKAFGDRKEEIMERVHAQHLMGKAGVPGDIARAALYLATEDWVTGTNMVVDGGLYHRI
jgi:NAD(P)-dependent dehydrogenase (short-subunit alcohol dehydrogenase family)